MKYYGKVGFAEYSETAPDVWGETIVERNYYGDVTKNTRRWSTGEMVNEDLVVSNRVSIVCDPYAYNNFHSIKYCVWMNTKWKVTNVEVAYPRLHLDLGGVYNEQS
jgi:hypothetical protein